MGRDREKEEERGKENKDNNGPGEEIFIGNYLNSHYSLGENIMSANSSRIQKETESRRQQPVS